MVSRVSRPALLLATALTLSAFGATAAFAQGAEPDLTSIEKQIKALQAELRAMKAQAAVRDRELKAAQAKAATPPPMTSIAPVMPQIPAGYALVPASPGSAPGSVVLARAEAPKPASTLGKGTIQVGAMTLQLGGFFDSSSIFRSRNEAQDITSSFTSLIPTKNSQLYHEPEFRETARATRIQGMLTGNPDEVTKVQGFLAVDFQGAASTSNSNQSNSFVPRMREAWVSYDRSDLGFGLLFGQTWSLLTMTKLGVSPTNINLPIGIDAGYVPGFDYLRTPQIRVSQKFLNTFTVAVSAENAQTTYAGNAPSIAGTVLNVNNAQTSGIDTGVTLSNNFAPDVVAKLTADYPIAHFETYGVGSLFNDRISTLTHSSNATVMGGGVGAAALVHVLPKLVDFQISGLYGDGVGRYGASQLPDATYQLDGKPRPLPAYSILAGLVGHPTKKVDIYAYAGTEHVSAGYDNTVTDTKGKLSDTVVGYGSPFLSNAGCNEELQSNAAPFPDLTCTAATKGDAQITAGGWYKFLQGNYGTMEVGAQYSYTRRFIFPGSGTSFLTPIATPKTDENMVFVSFRWFPFQ